MKRGLSRRNPYPADCVYDGKALMLGELSKGGGYVASKPADAEGAAPTNPKYSGQNPVLERVADWSDLSMGLGLRRQEGPSQARYHYAEGVDCSIQGLILKGPKVTFVDIANWDPWPTGMYGLVEFNGWLFGLNGHHLHRRLSDVAWEHFADFGANVAYSATHFHSNVAGGTSILLLAMGTEPPRRITTGGSIQVCGDAIPAYQFLVVGRDLYRHHSTNLLSKCDSDADYWDVDNWGAENQFTIGDQAYNITSLAVTASGVLVITKPDGIYTLGPGGEHVQLFPYLRDITPTAGGEATTNWLNDIYTARTSTKSASIGHWKQSPPLFWASVRLAILFCNLLLWGWLATAPSVSMWPSTTQLSTAPTSSSTAPGDERTTARLGEWLSGTAR
jgi:hypothetical protein